MAKPQPPIETEGVGNDQPFGWHSQVVRQGPAKPPSLSSNLSATFNSIFLSKNLLRDSL